jgi:hypothetical protein
VHESVVGTFMSVGCLENGRTTPEADVRPCSYQAAIEPVRALTKGRDAQALSAITRASSWPTEPAGAPPIKTYGLDHIGNSWCSQQLAGRTWCDRVAAVLR